MSDLSAKVREALDAAVTAIGGAPREGQIELGRCKRSPIDITIVRRHRYWKVLRI